MEFFRFVRLATTMCAYQKRGKEKKNVTSTATIILRFVNVNHTYMTSGRLLYISIYYYNTRKLRCAHVSPVCMIFIQLFSHLATYTYVMRSNSVVKL